MHVDTSTVDLSTPESKHRTLTEGAAQHRADASRLEAQATELRARAAGMDDKPGLTDTADSFRREAGKLMEDAAQRLGAAAAFEERATDFAAERVTGGGGTS